MGNASENKTPVLEIINFLKFNKNLSHLKTLFVLDPSRDDVVEAGNENGSFLF